MKKYRYLKIAFPVDYWLIILTKIYFRICKSQLFRKQEGHKYAFSLPWEQNRGVK